MRTTQRGLLAASLMIGALALSAPHGFAAEPLAAKAALDALKSLAGEWTGSVMKPDGPPAKVNFRVTSGGSAVFEQQFAGTDHEMTSVYHLDGAELVMTHYCAAGNQPRMRLNREKSSAKELVFDFAGGTNLDPAKDGHVHAGRIRVVGDGRFEAEWYFHAGGKRAGTNSFFMARPAK